MKRRNRNVEQSSLSFLDAISCGFGAIIILVVITKSAPPSVEEPTPVVNAAQAQQLSLLAQQTAGEREAVEAELAAAEATRAAAAQALASLRVSADSARDKVVETRQDTVVTTTLERQLAQARQTLTEEMRRLQGSAKARPDGPVAGIPVDSQYVIFVIDTSGSMQQMAWRSVQQKMNEALDAYPQIKGFQVMSDMGEYMFSSYRGDWIPDTPARRRTVLQRLTNWAPFSNSSPVEGITAAIRTYARADRKISIYVFGDDFTGRSINDVVLTVRRINPRDRSGRPSVRIHGIGFPVLMNNRGAADGALRFANLMRVLAEESGGAFIGLENTR
ncbi:MAG: VWA domain-containing protein [Gammaproteobacteria bacterium]|nr:VWA domain-containing protein [Gammaproteobacteria bacterium]